MFYEVRIGWRVNIDIYIYWKLVRLNFKCFRQQAHAIQSTDGEREQKIMSFSRSFLFVSVLSSITVTAHYDIDDSLLYKIDFPGLSQDSINPSKL